MTPNLDKTPDIKVSVKQTFGIDSKMEVDAFSKKGEYVPEIDKNYKFDRDTTLAIISGFAFNKRVLVQGYHGTGKSTHIEQIAARLNWPCIRVNLDSHISRIDLIGKDAIVLKDPSYLVQQLNFKVGLTARFSPNLMPINEGVIITKPDSKECIDFFAHYMGTYEAIKDDSIIKSVSQNDLMRWRGGQLSLNAVCKGVKLLDPRDSSKDVKILPCRKYNYAVKSKDEVFKLKRNSYVHIAHIKGKAKY